MREKVNLGPGFSAIENRVVDAVERLRSLDGYLATHVFMY